MEELKAIIARMVAAGESEENIKLVIEAYQAKNAGKLQPQVPGAPVEEIAAPDMESKLEDGSLVSPQPKSAGMIDRISNWFTSLIDDTVVASNTASTQAELTDTQAYIAKKIKEVGTVTENDVAKLIDLDNRALEEGLTDSEKSLNETYDAIEAYAKAGGLNVPGQANILPPAAQAFLGSLIMEPKGAVVSIARSMASMAKSEEARKLALQTGLASAGTTGVATAMTGPGAIPAAAGSFFAGAMAGANLAMETSLTLNDLVKDEIENYDDLTYKEKAKALVNVFNDSEKYEKLLLRAQARGVTITGIDLATGKLGGLATGKVTKTALKAGTSKIKQGLAEIVVEEGVEKTGAYLGELAGQKAAGQELNFKDAAMEAIGGFEVITRPAGAGFKGLRTIVKPSSYSIQGSQVSRETMLKFINANDGVDLAATGATVEINGDSDVKNLFVEKARKATIKTQIGENITNEADRDKIAELELERQTLKNNKTRLARQRLSEVEAEIDAIGEQYKPKRGRPTKEIAEARQRLKAEAERVTRAYKQAGTAKTVAFAEAVAKKYGFSTVAVDNTKDFKVRIAQLSAEKNVALPMELLKKIERVGGTVVGGTIIINKEVAAKTKQFNVGAHEVLHPILNAKLYSLNNASEIIQELKSNFSDKQIKAIEFELDRRGYEDPIVRAKEYLTVMSDMMNTKDKTGKALLDFDENKNAWEKVGQWLVDKIFRPLGFGDQAGFADGKQVYQFMREYQKSIAQGELTKATEKAIGKLEGIEGAEFELSKNAQKDIDALGADQTKAEWDAGGSNLAIADLYGDGVLDALIGSKITNEMRYLPGFSEEDFISEGVAELIQHIRNFNPEKNNSLNGWIMSQLANKAKTVLKKQTAGTKAIFESQIDEGTVADEIDEFDQYDEIGFDIDLIDEGGNLINPLDFLAKEDLLPYRQAIKKALAGIEKIDKLTFKTLEDLIPELTAKTTGIELKKILNPKANLTTGEIKVMQKFIYDNADKLIKLLPEGAVLEAASEKLIGTGTNVPRKLLEYFYDKNPRLTLGQGLSPFEKRSDITKEEFLEAFGINLDGTFKNFGGQDQRAQGIFALGRLIGKLMTNTAVRQELEYQQVSKNTIIDVGAGRSEFMLSIQAAEDNYINLEEDRKDTKAYAAMHNETISKNRLRLKNLGLTDAQIDELEAESIKHTIKPTTNQKQWNKDAIVENSRFTKELMSYVPINLKVRNLQTVFVGMAGNHTIYNARQINFDKSQSYSVYDENGERLTNNQVKALQFKFEDTYNIETGKGSYPQYLIDAINEFENAYYQRNKTGNFKLNKKGKKVPKPFKKRFLVVNTTRKELKNLYTGFNEQEAVEASKNSFNAEKDAIRVLYHKAVALSFQAYFESLKTPEQKLAALKQFKKIYSSSAIANGFKASVKLGGIVFDNRGEKAKYHFEHVLSAVDMYAEMFENLITGKRSFKTPEAWLIPRDTAVAFDKTYLKTADRDTFVTELIKESNKQGRRVITPDNNNFQLSIAPTLDTMIDTSLNEMVSEKLNIDEKSNISEFQARRLGRNKGKFKFFVPPSADDFMGLMYYLVRKGRQGDADLAFIKENLIDPFAKAQRTWEEYKMGTLKAYRKLKKNIRNTPANLKKEAIDGFTNEQALRVFMWNNLGFEIPGINEAEIKAIKKYVNNNKELLEFSKQIQNMLITDFPKPQESWASGSLTIDVLEHINEQARKEFFADFNAIAEETFGKMNNRGEITGDLANKLRAAFGDNYIEALSDILYRMKVGRSREFGRNRLVNQLENYINGSIATIMFFNTRSAILQMVSFVNFINFSDNNPIAAAKAYADLPQLSKDIIDLMNSDYLVTRRNGLKIDVAADDIAKSAEGSANKAGAAITTILKAGYLPTQFADSFAIAFGGATFYRNRINTYMREGLSEEAAKDKAYSDWKETAEESQQSSRPDKISQQQASTLGRLILAFGNTPMQYARITKKAALDLLANRGDAKTNLSKLLYYGTVQNIMFTGLQQALFSLWLDDEPEDKEEEVEKYVSVIDSAIDGFGRGLGYGGAVAVMVKNVVQEAMDEYGEGGRKNFQDVILEIGTISPAISSKISRLEQGARTFTWKQELEKVRTEGISLDNPAFEASGKFVSAATNVPLDRVIRKMDNLSYPFRHEVQTYQAIALALGWGQWELGLKEVNKQETNKREQVGFKKPKIKKPKIK